MIGSELTSTRSPRVTAARRLIKRALRDRDGRFLAEGPQACREAAREPGVLIDLYVTTDAAQRHSDIVDAAKAAGPYSCLQILSLSVHRWVNSLVLGYLFGLHGK